jgi:DNA-binding NarL/FixJ family response regulator
MARVFVVEDHTALRKLIVDLVERAEGFEVCGSSDSAETALEHLENAPAELALIDISLPGKNGIELVRDLQKRRPDIRCVLLSGHVASSYVDDARAAGAKAYVPKSQAKELLATLRLVLQGGSRFPSF